MSLSRRCGIKVLDRKSGGRGWRSRPHKARSRKGGTKGSLFERAAALNFSVPAVTLEERVSRFSYV